MLRDRLGKDAAVLSTAVWEHFFRKKDYRPGELPEVWNLEHAEEVMEIHREYYQSGK